MDVDAFLAWPGDGVNRLHALIDGEPVAMSPTTLEYSSLLAEVSGEIRNHLRAHRPHCRVLTEPGVQPRARASKNVRIPDISVSCRQPSGKLLPDPLLIIEILSPSNEREPREAVRSCLTIPSLREAVILHNQHRRAEIYRLAEDGAWPAERVMLEADDDLELTSIGFRHALTAFYLD